MRKHFDFILMGAGPAALGALCALQIYQRKSVLQLSGDSFSSLSSPSWIDAGISSPDFKSASGLPHVRAFGTGGSTKLWHGGLFVPHAHDSIESIDGIFRNGADLLSVLDKISSVTDGLRNINAFSPLLEVVRHAKTVGGFNSIEKRDVLIPRGRHVLSKGDFVQVGSGLKNYALMPDVIVDAQEANGKLEILLVDGAGFKTVTTDRLLLAGGVLGSAILLRKILGIKELVFSDHYHVFAGAIQNAVWEKLKLSNVTSISGSFRPCLKFTIELDSGEMVDVGFSARRVANPNFPRSGRRFGELVAVNGLSFKGKVNVALNDPFTVAEMLFFKKGIELPFSTRLIHATVAPRSMDGKITASGVSFNIPREKIVNAVQQAWKKLEVLSGSKLDSFLFRPNEISNSIISGAQFVGSLSTGQFNTSVGLMSRIVLADCSRFKYTSIYNQGLISLAAGFSAISSLG